MAKKGQKFKLWTAEEKYRIIEPIIKYEKSSKQVTRETGINNGMITQWVHKYNDFGMEGPVMSASRIATSNPLLLTSLASREVISDLPTPPLPLTTANTCLTSEYSFVFSSKLNSEVREEQF